MSGWGKGDEEEKEKYDIKKENCKDYEAFLNEWRNVRPPSY